MRIVNDLSDLMIEELSNLYNADKKQLEGLQRMKEHAQAKELKDIIEEHQETKLEQIRRLERVFNTLNKRPIDRNNTVIQEMIKAGLHCAKRSADRRVADASIINTIQNIKHYGIGNYGAACTYAHELGYKNVAEILHLNLEEEKWADERLIQLAVTRINLQAKQAGNHSH